MLQSLGEWRQSVCQRTHAFGNHWSVLALGTCWSKEKMCRASLCTEDRCCSAAESRLTLVAAAPLPAGSSVDGFSGQESGWAARLPLHGRIFRPRVGPAFLHCRQQILYHWATGAGPQRTDTTVGCGVPFTLDTLCPDSIKKAPEFASSGDVGATILR